MQKSFRCGNEAKTYDEFKCILRKRFGGQLTMYQMLSSVWDVQYSDPGAEFIVYGAAIHRAIRTAKENILVDYKERTGKDMTIDEYNDVISGMLMMDKLKGFHPEIYRSMVGNSATVNELKNSIDVARHAETLRSRYQGDSLHAKKDESFYGTGVYTDQYEHEREPEELPRDDRYENEQTEQCEQYYGNDSGLDEYSEPQNESTVSSNDEHSASEHYASRPKRRRKRRRQKSLFVGGLSEDTGEDELFCHFSRFGDISDIYIPADHDGYSRCFAFVRYYEREDAIEAQHTMHGRCIDGNQIRVTFAKTRPGMS